MIYYLALVVTVLALLAGSLTFFYKQLSSNSGLSSTIAAYGLLGLATAALTTALLFSPKE